MEESHKIGVAEIIRPRLEAGKLPRHQVVVSEFSGVVDTERLLEKSLNGQKDSVQYKVFASTWNVGGIAPSDDLDLEDWLDRKANSYDIYVLGFQEIVPLNARNVLGPKNISVSMKWNSLIGDALNKKKTTQEHYRCIMSKQMVGIYLSIWARSCLSTHIRHPTASCVGSGILGCLGNKGAVSVRFMLHNTTFCFVCCHLASGGKEGDVLLRNSDAGEILSRTSFPRCGDTAPELPRRILDHDRVVLLGDLNYRISMEEAEAWSLVKAKKWSMLLENDELLFELSKGRRFDGWHEGLIRFSPTYKYHRNSDKYYWRIDKRAPAWCDRILWRGKGLKQVRYERCSHYWLSDHRPVRAVFHAVCEVRGVVESLGGFCALK